MPKINLNSSKFNETFAETEFDNYLLQCAREDLDSLSEEELDLDLKRHLDSLQFPQMIALFRAVQRLNAWLEFFMNDDSYEELINAVMPPIIEKNSNLSIQYFAEQMIKLTKSDKKSYLYIAVYLIKEKHYDTLELIDTIILLYQRRNHLVLKERQSA